MEIITKPIQTTKLPKRVGLIAAWGRYPILVAQALKEQGVEVQCLGIERHADPVLKDICDDFQWLCAARLGQAIRYFNRRGVTQATMAGKIHKVEMYKPWVWFRYIPDYTFIRTFYQHFFGVKADRRDDTLLGALVDAFAKGGVEFLPATDFAPELLVKPGQISGRPLSKSQLADIDFGWKLAKEMGGLDVGQSVCVKNRAVIAVEAIEGTDASILRAGELCPRGGFTVVKVAKPNQDMRFDVPTVGAKTLRTMAQAGGKVLAIEGEKTILLDEQEFQMLANQLKIAVVALSEGEQAAAAA